MNLQNQWNCWYRLLKITDSFIYSTKSLILSVILWKPQYYKFTVTHTHITLIIYTICQAFKIWSAKLTRVYVFFFNKTSTKQSKAYRQQLHPTLQITKNIRRLFTTSIGEIHDLGQTQVHLFGLSHFFSIPLLLL